MRHLYLYTLYLNTLHGKAIYLHTVYLNTLYLHTLYLNTLDINPLYLHQDLHIYIHVTQTHNMEDKYEVRHVGLKTSSDSVQIDYLDPVSVLQISLGNPELNSDVF